MRSLVNIFLADCDWLSCLGTLEEQFRRWFCSSVGGWLWYPCGKKAWFQPFCLRGLTGEHLRNQKNHLRSAQSRVENV